MAMSRRNYMALKTEISSFHFFFLKGKTHNWWDILSAKLQDAMIESLEVYYDLSKGKIIYMG